MFLRSKRSILPVWFLLPVALAAAALARGEAPAAAHPFFAFCVGLPKNDNPDFQREIPKLAAELGYDGLAYTRLNGALEILQAVDHERLKFFALYTTVNIDPDGPGVDPKLLEIIDQLKGRETIIWLGVVSKKFKPQSTEGDERAVELLRQVAQRAAAAGLRVALYPHVHCYAERIEDQLRLAEKVDRSNLGITFNLCHFLAAEDPAAWQDALRRAAPRLLLVSINGTSGFDPQNRAGWIQPLDSGTFDQLALVKFLDEIGYRGPVGVQCYGVPGEPREILQRSIGAWRDLTRRAKQ